MFKSLFLVFCLTFQFALHASGSDHEKHKGHSKMNSSKRAMLDKKDQKEVLQVLEANEALHASFFKYNAKEVEKQAKDLSVKIGKIQNKEIAKLLSFSALKLKEIKSTSNRDDNNKNYHLVSMALIHIVNKYDVGSKYNAYSCPMVKKKWLQNSAKMSKVHNPYAAGMPHCGSKDSKH